MASGVSSSEDLVYACISDPVDCDVTLFAKWVRGCTMKECLIHMKEQAMQKYEMRGLMSQRQLYRLFQCVEKDIIDQFRVFSMLESSLRRPALRHFRMQPINARLEKVLLAEFFAIEDRIMREVLRLRQSSKTKKRLKDIATRLNVRVGYCTRQMENLDIILDYVQSKNYLRNLVHKSTASLREAAKDSPLHRNKGSPKSITASLPWLARATSDPNRMLPGDSPSKGGVSALKSNERIDAAAAAAAAEEGNNAGLGVGAHRTSVHRPIAAPAATTVEQLIATDFGIPLALARKYSSLVFLCRYRMEINRGRLSTATLNDLIFFARTMMRHWTVRTVPFDKPEESGKSTPTHLNTPQHKPIQESKEDARRADIETSPAIKLENGATLKALQEAEGLKKSREGEGEGQAGQEGVNSNNVSGDDFKRENIGNGDEDEKK
eukprot:CAMPEP_0197530288 /NCGR_PEP_ID=MMETSP1318-20131121/31365_1 /TAXON_ID=552666 /ORGANISM="Partenskyella glossopodia, Strain RCC365" /LENGTH=435 /DNA_ID=CAMNT_0043086045 /DNA_START=129 /DNA_END=1433 /DNA_ORIENTATION=-